MCFHSQDNNNICSTFRFFGRVDILPHTYCIGFAAVCAYSKFTYTCCAKIASRGQAADLCRHSKLLARRGTFRPIPELTVQLVYIPLFSLTLGIQLGTCAIFLKQYTDGHSNYTSEAPRQTTEH